MDFEGFNLTLFPKYYWHIINSLSSLVTTCLQATYFPRWELPGLLALLGCRPSFLLAQPFGGEEPLSLGLQFCIGTVSPLRSLQISASLLQWSFLCLFSPIHGNHNQCCWREDRVRFFLHDEVDAIFQIPLNLVSPKDKLVWNFTSNGIYILKFGYRVSMDFIQRSGTAHNTSNSDTESQLQNKIHRLPVQQKIRMVIWRAASDIHPIGKNLMKQGLNENPLVFL